MKWFKIMTNNERVCYETSKALYLFLMICHVIVLYISNCIDVFLCKIIAKHLLHVLMVRKLNVS